MTDFDLSQLESWAGRQEVVQDAMAPLTATWLAASLDGALADFCSDGELPLGWHWAFFNPVVSAAEIDVDGHPKRGGFLPPVPLPRRMWASGEMELHAPLRLAVPAEKHSRIEAVNFKQGKSGPLVFVTVTHDYQQGGQSTIKETQHIVYREASTTAFSGRVAEDKRPAAQWHETVVADEVLLFRYSALTFNAHRIHHDADYTREVEGYPGLVVHGPLMATWLIDFAKRSVGIARLNSFDFRAHQPLFVNEKAELCGRRKETGAELWITCGGALIMSASATF